MRLSGPDAATVTYEDYLGWPETTAPVEVVDGQTIVSPAPHLRHQAIVLELAVVLRSAVPPHLRVVASPLDWVLARAPLQVRQPDIAVIRAEQLTEARLSSPPLLAVEVLSPASRERDLVTKRTQYAAAGLEWYWLVDPDGPHITVLRQQGRGYVTHASAAADQTLAVAEPFPVELRPADLQS